MISDVDKAQSKRLKETGQSVYTGVSEEKVC